MKGDAVKAIGLLLVVVALFIVWPLLFIWALNTLFPILMIPYSLQTWSAMLVVFTLFAAKVVRKK